MSFNFKRHWVYLLLTIILLISIIINIIYIPKALQNKNQYSVDDVTIAFYNNNIGQANRILGEFSVDHQKLNNLTDILSLKLMHDAHLQFKSFSMGTMLISAFGLSGDSKHYWSITSDTNAKQCGGADKPSCDVGANLLRISSNDRYNIFYTTISASAFSWSSNLSWNEN